VAEEFAGNEIFEKIFAWGSSSNPLSRMSLVSSSIRILSAANPLEIGKFRYQVSHKFLVAYRFVQVANWEIPLLEPPFHFSVRC